MQISLSEFIINIFKFKNIHYNNIIYNERISYYFSHKLHVFTHIHHFLCAEDVLRNDT